MPVPIETIPFIGRRRRRRTTAPPAPVALTLASATLDLTADPLVTLTFDRAVDVASIDVGEIAVTDGVDTFMTFVGTGVDGQPTAASVAVRLIESAPAAPGPAVLNATAETGIVAQGDGGTWAGVTELELPFP